MSPRAVLLALVAAAATGATGLTQSAPAPAAARRPAPGDASRTAGAPAPHPAATSRTRTASPGPTATTPARATRLAPVTTHAPALTAARQTDIVRTYCAGCHSARARAGGLSLAAFDAATAHETPAQVEQMIRKLRTGMMPPAGAKRPDAATLAALVTGLETRMDELAAARPDPGWRPFQRLNRAEYARAVRDLLGLDLDVSALLPADTISHGFDNVADAQTFSPTLLESYLRAAGRVAALAVGDPETEPTEATYKLPKTAGQMTRADGAPLGTRGGLSVVHTFPADGEYVFRADLFTEPLGFIFGNTAAGEQLEVSVDGARVALLPVDPKMSESTTGVSLRTPVVHVTAGPHRITAAFLQRFEGPVNDLIAPIEHTMADTEIGIAVGITTLPHLRSLSVAGPRRVTGVSDTVSRRRVFTCRPTSMDDGAACADRIIRDLSTRAFRQAPTERDVTRLRAFYARGREARNFEHGIVKVLEAVLASPRFLFRVEAQPATARAGQVFTLDDHALASRLSFFLWGSAPDAALRQAADAGRLATTTALDRQVARLLADPRSEALATRFAAQWLRLQDLDKITPDPILYPYYDTSLAATFRRETELFVDSLVREDRSVLDLLTADYTFANERVARHYGIPNVTGTAFRRVTLPPERRGLLGHASILTLTSIADRTSPVQRGKWVMEVLLGSPPPPPPPNVPALDESAAATADGRSRSVRERMEQHRANPACAACHKVIDPLGLALEHFDPTGRYRIKDSGVPVDAAGDLYDGTRMDGASGLRAALLQHKDAVLLSLTEHLMTYALGRRLEPADMPTVRGVIRAAARQDYRVSAFVRGIVQSAAFRMSRPAAATLDTGAPAAQP